MIEWNGGECPVKEGVRVDVRFRNGSTLTGERFDWRHFGSEVDIVAYDIVLPAEERSPDTRYDPRRAVAVNASGSETWVPPAGHLVADATARKGVPIYNGLVRYFPDALVAIAELSRKGNDQHNPGKPLHWDRSKSGDELDALMRHLVDAGTLDSDGVRHSTKVAWRALANLQKEIEEAKR